MSYLFFLAVVLTGAFTCGFALCQVRVLARLQRLRDTENYGRQWLFTLVPCLSAAIILTLSCSRGFEYMLLLVVVAWPLYHMLTDMMRLIGMLPESEL